MPRERDDDFDNGPPHIRTAGEAIEEVKESILEETQSRRPTINQNALLVSFLNLQNAYQVFLYLWFTAMAVVAFLILFDKIDIDSHNRSIYMGTSVIVTGILIMGILIVSGFHQERNRSLSKQHFLNINIPWMSLVAFSVAFSLAYSLLDTEIENEIGEKIFDDDDSFTNAKFEGKTSEAIIYALYILAAIIPAPYMAKAIFTHANPQTETPEPDFTADVRATVEHGGGGGGGGGGGDKKRKKRSGNSAKKQQPTKKHHNGISSNYRSVSRPPVRSMY